LEKANARGWNRNQPDIRSGHQVRIPRDEHARVRGIKLRYDDIIVVEQTADPLVEGTVVVELKTVKTLDCTHAAQCINCLKTSGQQLCLLLNFGKRCVEVHRVANGD
jgi:GxxExxY protein